MRHSYSIWDLILILANEHNGTSNLSGGSLENSTSITSSPELKACYSTTCSNILSLAYSPHNTLIATGIASSTSSPTAGISALATLNSNNMRVNKPVASMGLSSNSIVNPSNNQATSAGFTKIFINGTGSNLGKWYRNIIISTKLQHNCQSIYKVYDILFLYHFTQRFGIA